MQIYNGYVFHDSYYGAHIIYKLKNVYDADPENDKVPCFDTSRNLGCGYYQLTNHPIKWRGAKRLDRVAEALCELYREIPDYDPSKAVGILYDNGRWHVGKESSIVCLRDALEKHKEASKVSPMVLLGLALDQRSKMHWSQEGDNCFKCSTDRSIVYASRKITYHHGNLVIGSKVRDITLDGFIAALKDIDNKIQQMKVGV